MDPVTISALASTAVELLKPFLAKAGETAVQTVGQKLYDLLKARLEQGSPAETAMTDLAKEPEDADLQAQMRVQLKKLLQEDPQLASQIQQLAVEAKQTPAGGTVINQKAGDKAIQVGQNYGQVQANQN